MLDVKALLQDPDAVKRALQRRNPNLEIDEVLQLAQERREVAGRFDNLRHLQKEASQDFKRQDLSAEERQALQVRVKEMSNEVKSLESRRKELEAALESSTLLLPNLPADDVPQGQDEADNPILRTWGEGSKYDFEPREHGEIGEALGIFDFEAARKISGARFVLYRGLGARLERALAAFMLDTHIDEHGYEEVLPPFLVQRETMVGTGQLPKFEEDAFRTEPDDLFLVPTAEVPVTNIHRDEILDAEDLPRRYVAQSSCFRREAGSYGRDTHGLTRLHQFQKVEMVQFCRPEDSVEAHVSLTLQAEVVLQRLGLPYRVVELCTGDLGFCAQKCFDIEVWLGGQKCWREISSCSNFGDFQARRANIRFRPEPGAKPRFVHTLNGSGLAIGRTIIALLEHYQSEDGSVDLPEVLWPYMRVKRLEKT